MITRRETIAMMEKRGTIVIMVVKEANVNGETVSHLSVNGVTTMTRITVTTAMGMIVVMTVVVVVVVVVVVTTMIVVVVVVAIMVIMRDTSILR